jgi:acetyltransferase-like isoleucine patch superfamily enzyme
MDGIETGEGCRVHESVHVVRTEADQDPPYVGPGSVIRSNSVIYPDVVVGGGLQTGHGVVVREATTVGEDAVIGTATVIDGHVDVGASVSMQTGVYVPPETRIGDRVFLGPRAVLTNDPYPLRADVDLAGATLEDDVSVGANATILPDVTVGKRSFVAAGAVVTGDVPPRTLAVGSPARHRPLPERLDAANTY